MNIERLLCAMRASPLWISPELQHGVDRNPGPNLAFDEFWYRHEHPEADADIKAGRYRSGWEHYLAEGAAKQYNPVFWFDERWYRRQDSEVDAAVANRTLSCGFEHYLLYGVYRDATPSIYFHPQWYRERYMHDEVDEQRTNPIVHYLLQDPKRRGCPVPFFEPEWYAQQYGVSPPDGDSSDHAMAAYEHYLLFGRRLGHSPSPYFNEAAYREIPQVAAKLRAGLYVSGFEHYVAEGPANGFHASTHLLHSGVDYTGPEYLKIYERSLLLHLTQMKKLCDLTEQ
jgi:O-antigen biosynthesis protein